MPELPEVETIRNRLQHSPILGKTITHADLLWERTLAEPGPGEFATRLTGQALQEMGRRGKFLIFRFTRDTLLLHLRMSGDLLLEPAGDPLLAHHRLVLYFTDGLRLAFNDPRKFGRAWLVADPQTVLGNLGPEPFDPAFTPQELHRRLQAYRRQLKPLLLDQAFLAGLGNIYADEALHLAGLHPLALSHHLTADQAERLWRSIRQVLEAGIQQNGASIDWVYRGGGFQHYFHVYQRTGQACPVCGTKIERILVGQRGTHFCPQCQPL